MALRFIQFFSAHFRTINMLIWFGIAALCFARAALATVPGDNHTFIAGYTYFTNDSYDWIANGIGLFSDVPYSVRNVGLSLIIRVLYFANSLWLLPFVNQLAFLLLLWSIVEITKQVTQRRWTGYVVLALLMWNYSVQQFSLLILSDYYALAFVALATVWILRKKFALSSAALAVSALFQNFAFFLYPLWFVAIAYYLRPQLRQRRLKQFLIALVPLVAIQLPWLIYKFVTFGSPLFSRSDQFALLRPNLNSMGFYLVNGYSLFGLVAVLAVLGYIWKRPRFTRPILFLAANLVIAGLFWLVVYEWNDRRFLLYLLPFIYPLFGYGLLQLFPGRVKLWQPLLLVLLAFPSFISLGSALRYNYLPLTPWQGVEFSVQIESNNQAFINLPVKRAAAEPTIFQAVYPALREVIKDRQNRPFPTTKHHTYFETLKQRFNPTLRKFCGTFGGSYYVLGSYMQIYYGTARSQVEFDPGCELN